MRIKKSKCLGNEIEMNDSKDKKDEPKYDQVNIFKEQIEKIQNLNKNENININELKLEIEKIKNINKKVEFKDDPINKL